LPHTVSFTISEVYHDTHGKTGVLQDITLEKYVDKNNWTLSAGKKFSVTMSYRVDFSFSSDYIHSVYFMQQSTFYTKQFPVMLISQDDNAKF